MIEHSKLLTERILTKSTAVAAVWICRFVISRQLLYVQGLVQLGLDTLALQNWVLLNCLAAQDVPAVKLLNRDQKRQLSNLVWKHLACRWQHYFQLPFIISAEMHFTKRLKRSTLSLSNVNVETENYWWNFFQFSKI